ncbi:MAG TPA: Uma2 family endonuclease [Oscillatoriaceae cyanobacterium M33_DOE_052]|uniref:Uma2 family endonuclease n=1 Tax=Planktothricoides sp. SpSt-374 TaxID=2282167 RepID=A0A7C3VJR4_9CYAN|nr:Uma2 family endonuclease [Oscillatoriaceae cyanobacterium M33_DOE_052]
MVITTPDKTQISLTDFLQIPETDPARDYIEGEIYQKPMAQGEHIGHLSPVSLWFFGLKPKPQPSEG